MIVRACQVILGGKSPRLGLAMPGSIAKKPVTCFQERSQQIEDIMN